MSNAMNNVPYLHLDGIRIDLRIMRLLPPEIAYRYHALPVATDGNLITVAMAHPEDSPDSEAVISAIAAPVCLVQADPQEITKRLVEAWPQHPVPRPRFLIWSDSTMTGVSLESYAQLFAEILDAELVKAEIPWQGLRSLAKLTFITDQIRPDMIIFQFQSYSLLKRMKPETPIWKIIDQLPSSVIIPPRPRLTLSNVLLVLPDGDTEDESAIHWAVKLARSNQSTVTVLPLLPPVPGWYGSFIKHSLQALFEADDPLGKKMRSIAQRFSESKINGSFKLREGEPLDQLRDEILITDPDLIILPSPPLGCLRRSMTKELINPLLNWANRPVLISKEHKSK